MSRSCHYCTDAATSPVLHSADGCVRSCARHQAWKEKEAQAGRVTPGHSLYCEDHPRFSRTRSTSSTPPAYVPHAPSEPPAYTAQDAPRGAAARLAGGLRDWTP